MAAAQLRTGAALTPAYLHQIKQRPSDICVCGLRGHRTHLLTACPAFEKYRPGHWHNLPVAKILGDIPEQERLFQFIRKTRLGLRPPGPAWSPTESITIIWGVELEVEEREAAAENRVNQRIDMDSGRGEGQELWREIA